MPITGRISRRITGPISSGISIGAGQESYSVDLSAYIAADGETVTATITDAKGVNTPTYQWLRDGVAISGATGSSYTAVTADNGTKLTCECSWTDDDGTAKTARSAPANIIAPVIFDGTIPLLSMDNLEYDANIYDASTHFQTGGAVSAYSLNGAPAWMLIDQTTGIISGTPDASGTTVGVTVIGTNYANSQPSNAFNVDAVANPPVFSNGPIPPISVQEDKPITPAVSTSQYFTTGGPVDTYSLTNAPVWLSIDSSTGVISGTPTTGADAIGVTVNATNVDGTDSSNAFDITVVDVIDAPVYSGVPIPTLNGNVNVSITPYDVAAGGHFSGEDPPTVWQLFNAPAGITINTSTGVISGTPTAAGITSGLYVRATNNAGSADSNTFTADISAVVLPLFSRPFSTTASLEDDATFARGSTGSVQTFEQMQYALEDESRFEGANRIENLFTDTTTTLASGVATTAVNVEPGNYVFSMGAGAGTATVSGTATGATGARDADAANRTALALTITGAGTIIVTASVADLADIMLQDKTGSSTPTIPDAYVSVGVLSDPWHGAGIDGVKYNPYDNGNSVDVNGIVTEAQGAPLSGISLLMEPAATNLVLNSTPSNTGTWQPYHEGAALPSVTLGYAPGPDGDPEGGTRFVIPASLDAPGDLSISYTNITVASGAYHVASIYAKAVTGTPIVSVSLGDSAFSSDTSKGSLQLTSDWQRIYHSEVSTATGGNVGVGSYYDEGGRAGDEYIIACTQGETGTVPTSYIKTEGAVLSRAVDTLQYPLVTPQTEGMALLEYAPPFPSTSPMLSNAIIAPNVSAAIASAWMRVDGAATGRTVGSDGSGFVYGPGDGVYDALDRIKSALYWEGADMEMGWDASGGWTYGGVFPYDGAWTSNDVLRLSGDKVPIRFSNVEVYDINLGKSWIEGNF